VAVEMVARDHTHESACSQAHITELCNSVKCLPNHLSPTGSRSVPVFLVFLQALRIPPNLRLSLQPSQEWGSFRLSPLFTSLASAIDGITIGVQLFLHATGTPS